MPYLLRDIQKIIQNSFVFINLYYNSKDIFDYGGKLSKFCIVKFDLCVQISFEFIKEVMSPLHVLENKSSRLFKLLLVFFEIGPISKEGDKVINKELFLFICLWRHQIIDIRLSHLLKNNKLTKLIPHLIFQLNRKTFILAKHFFVFLQGLIHGCWIDQPIDEFHNCDLHFHGKVAPDWILGVNFLQNLRIWFFDFLPFDIAFLNFWLDDILEYLFFRECLVEGDLVILKVFVELFEEVIIALYWVEHLFGCPERVEGALVLVVDEDIQGLDHVQFDLLIDHTHLLG